MALLDYVGPSGRSDATVRVTSPWVPLSPTGPGSPTSGLEQDSAPGALLVRCDIGRAPTRPWAVMAFGPTLVLVNGLPLSVGMRMLAEGDEVQVGERGRRFRFSGLDRAQPELLPADRAPLRCPRCASDIETGGEAVKCPACGAWHHEQPSLPCWSYAVRCAVCDHPTDQARPGERRP